MMKDLIGFIKDLGKIIYGAGFKFLLMRNNNDGALFIVNAWAGAVADDCKTEIRDMIWCVPCIVPCFENRVIVQKGLTKKYNIDFTVS